MRTRDLVPLRSLSLLAALVVAMAASGCASSRPRRTAAANEPPLIGDASGATLDGGTAVVQAPESRAVTFADRHPMISRPREYYDTVQGNKLRKTAAAAFLGIPSGLGAEARQIFVGQAPMR